MEDPNLHSELKSLAGHLGKQSSKTSQPRYNLEIVMGEAISIASGILTVELFDGTQIECRCLLSYSIFFTAGDKVIILKWGPTYLCIGEFAT